MTIVIKRVYEAPLISDGKRVLIDRLWPRGLTKEKARIDLWLKDVAPSTDLRKWFGHDPAKWLEFYQRYTQELIKNVPAISKLVSLAKQGKVTLIYSAKDKEHNDAVVLNQYLNSIIKPK